MTKQILFTLALLVTLGFFSYTSLRIFRLFRLTRPAFPVRDMVGRFVLMCRVAIGQTKIFRRPVTGFFHALVFWGFCVIAFGSIEMVVDGVTGAERSLGFLGPVHTLITASGDLFALLVALSILVFLARRLFLPIRRFEGIEMKPVSHMDAKIALTLILLLMLSLLGMNAGYAALRQLTAGETPEGYPVGSRLAHLLSGWEPGTLTAFTETCWWTHILLIFLFANILPYSKHFHVFMSVPNVFLSRMEPLGKLANMESITREVKLMLDPSAMAAMPADTPVERFGVKDAEDISWKNYLDALSCTECGRCTSVCPANLTGKRLSPRKIMMDVRARMKNKALGLLREGKEYSDGKALVRDWIAEEEIWACTTCNACARECPININHPSLILDMRRYLMMEEGAAPGGLKAVCNNIENNGAPWQFSPEDRLLWARDMEMNVNQPAGI